MVFVKFISSDPARNPAYFVGPSLEAVLDDLNYGKRYGENFTTYELLDETQARALSLLFIDEGIKAVRGGCKSFMLATRHVDN